MKYIKKLNIDFDQWNKLNDSRWHNMKFVKGKTIDYYEKKYPIGTKVKIRKDSIYYKNTRDNPKDTIGYINYVEFMYNKNIIINDYIFHVKWNNNGQNSYKIIDLKYYKE
jgi:hypothetical protein